MHMHWVARKNVFACLFRENQGLPALISGLVRPNHGFDCQRLLFLSHKPHVQFSNPFLVFPFLLSAELTKYHLVFFCDFFVVCRIKQVSIERFTDMLSYVRDTFWGREDFKQMPIGLGVSQAVTLIV